MHKHEKNKLINELIAESKSIAIIPSKISGVDAFCAGVGLYHVLKNHDKKVELIYPGRLPDGTDGLIDEKDITSNVKRRDLVVAIDYAGTDIEKVQYSTEDGVFYLRFGPVARDFDVNKVKAEIHGHKHDMYIIIGAQVPEDLGQTHRELHQDLLVGKIVNLDNTDRNTRFGHYNIVDPLKDSVSLLTMHAVLDWEFTVGTDAAQAFLKGIAHRKI
jgi:hypothetical protein